MIPESVEEFNTEGERQFYMFLETVARPDVQYITWYTPDIEGKEPDFILFNHNVEIGSIVATDKWSSYLRILNTQ